MRTNKNGFTLIELLAVIIILGVLMIIAIPSVTTVACEWKKDSGHWSVNVSGQNGAVNMADLPECNPSIAGQIKTVLDCGAGKKACRNTNTTYTCNIASCNSSNLVYSWRIATCTCN